MRKWYLVGMGKKGKVGLFFLFLFVLCLLTPPFISVPKGMTSGVPNLMIYIGSVWTVLILLMGAVFYKRKSPKG